MSPSLSVIIPVYRAGTMFQRCLAGIAELAPRPSEVIVVVDGDDAASAAIAEPFLQQGVISLLRTAIFQRALPWSRFLRRQGDLPNDLNLNHDARGLEGFLPAKTQA